MADRLITLSPLALFSCSSVIGAWWQDHHAINPKRMSRPATKALEELLFDAGWEHEKMLIALLWRDHRRVAQLRGKQDEADYDATPEAMRSGADFIWQASLRNGEMRGSAVGVLRWICDGHAFPSRPRPCSPAWPPAG